MILELDNNKIRTLIPNIIHEVEGETPLYEKILPWIEASRQWLELNIIGDYSPTDSMLQLVEKIIVSRAFTDAIPSLDLTLSPAGFAVISTEGRAPASKERVERLLSSLRSYVDSNITVLSRELPHIAQWRGSSIGKWFLSTFIPDLTDAHSFRGDNTLLDTYRAMRDIAIRFEQELAERFLGHGFLRELRLQYPTFTMPGAREICSLIRTSELRYISAHFGSRKIKCPDEHEVWHLARPIISDLNYWPALKGMWQDEMAGKVEVEPFRNTRKGGMWL